MVSAQLTISGITRDSITLEPVPYVSIQIARKGYVTSNIEGNWTYERLLHSLATPVGAHPSGPPLSHCFVLSSLSRLHRFQCQRQLSSPFKTIQMPSSATQWDTCETVYWCCLGFGYLKSRTPEMQDIRCCRDSPYSRLVFSCILYPFRHPIFEQLSPIYFQFVIITKFT